MNKPGIRHTLTSPKNALTGNHHHHLSSFIFHSVDPYRITKSIWIWK